MIAAQMTSHDKPIRSVTVQVNARVNADSLKELERIGNAMPIPANRSEMINLAIREFVERNAKVKSKVKSA